MTEAKDQKQPERLPQLTHAQISAWENLLQKLQEAKVDQAAKFSGKGDQNWEKWMGIVKSEAIRILKEKEEKNPDLKSLQFGAARIDFGEPPCEYETFKDFIDAMAKPNAWADETALYAILDALGYSADIYYMGAQGFAKSTWPQHSGSNLSADIVNSGAEQRGYHWKLMGGDDNPGGGNCGWYVIAQQIQKDLPRFCEHKEEIVAHTHQRDEVEKKFVEQEKEDQKRYETASSLFDQCSAEDLLTLYVQVTHNRSFGLDRNSHLYTLEHFVPNNVSVYSFPQAFHEVAVSGEFKTVHGIGKEEGRDKTEDFKKYFKQYMQHQLALECRNHPQSFVLFKDLIQRDPKFSGAAKQASQAIEAKEFKVPAPVGHEVKREPLKYEAESKTALEVEPTKVKWEVEKNKELVSRAIEQEKTWEVKQNARAAGSASIQVIKKDNSHSLATFQPNQALPSDIADRESVDATFAGIHSGIYGSIKSIKMNDAYIAKLTVDSLCNLLGNLSGEVSKNFMFPSKEDLKRLNPQHASELSVFIQEFKELNLQPNNEAQETSVPRVK